MDVTLTNEGYLKNLDDWTPDVAIYLANLQNIELSDQHNEVINLIRDFYQEYKSSPAIRALVNAMKQKLGAEKGNSLYLHGLFPQAAKQATCIAGLPKPIRCI